MRAFFSNEDMANLLVDVYNENTLPVTLIDEVEDTRTDVDMVSYLDIKFETWWHHAQTAIEELAENGGNIRESWKQSLNSKLGESYALIEQLDEETITSQDIVGATIMGRITFMIDANKVKNLEYYLRYLKNLYTGKPIKREASTGDSVIGYLTLGILLYDQEPTMGQTGEHIVATLNWRFNYMNIAATYDDVKLEISLGSDIEADYKVMPMIKYTAQNQFTKEPVPVATRVDLTGMLITAITKGITISFYDFEKALTNEINALFWKLGAYKIDDVVQSEQAVNIPVYLRATVGGHKYTFYMVITNMEKVFANNEFIISSIALALWGKVGA